MMQCPICKNQADPAFKPRIWQISPTGRAFGYSSCRGCQLTFCSPLPTKEELDRYYTTEFNYNWYAKHKLQKRIQGYHRWLRVRRQIEQHPGRRGRLLDIGCGYGWFIAAARRSGWQVGGIELSAEAVAFARRRLGLNVTCGALEVLPPPSQSYDVITLWHSLEHLRDPTQALGWIRAALKPGGVALIAVPNINSRGQKRRGVAWTWLQQPFVHLWHFSARSLGLMLEQVGFEILAVQTRDTWDAQYLYDGVIAPQLEGRYFRKLAQLMEALLRRLKFSASERIREYLYLILCESSRAAAYLLYLAIAPLTRSRQPDGGSELLVTARIGLKQPQ